MITVKRELAGCVHSLARYEDVTNPADGRAHRDVIVRVLEPCVLRPYHEWSIVQGKLVRDPDAKHEDEQGREWN